MLASCKKNLVHFPDVFAPLVSRFFRGGAFFLTLRGCPAPRALNFGKTLPLLTAAEPKFLSQPDPQFWKWALNFVKVVVPKKRPILGGKKILCTPKKKSNVRKWIWMCFLQKKWKKSVKFGLGKRSNISLPRIGGYHPVPSLSILLTERYGTAMYDPTLYSIPRPLTIHGPDVY